MAGRKKATKDTPFIERFKAIVDDKLEEENIRQPAIAEICSISPQQVNDYYNGRKSPDINSLAKISRGLGIPSDYFLGLTDATSIDADARFVEEYTGLSANAVKQLHYLKQINANSNAAMINLIMNEITEGQEWLKDTLGYDSESDSEQFAMWASESLLGLIYDYVEAKNKTFKFDSLEVVNEKDASVVVLKDYKRDIRVTINGKEHVINSCDMYCRLIKDRIVEWLDQLAEKETIKWLQLK